MPWPGAPAARSDNGSAVGADDLAGEVVVVAREVDRQVTTAVFPDNVTAVS
ncbi:hypothetical protein [Nocardia sp. NPDC004604]|uniref:hypothetical protein n=1 Tax=Nocardia sp. NPDC004604 TaxID=3157013 RepID=UPI0033B1700C